MPAEDDASGAARCYADRRLEPALADWRRDLAAAGRRARTVDAYLCDLRLLLETLTADWSRLTVASLLARCDSRELAALAAARARAGDQPRTLERRFAAWRAWCRHLSALGVPGAAAALAFRPNTETVPLSKQMPRLPSDRETASVEQYLPYLSDDPWIAHRDAAVLALMAACGLRLSEIVGLAAEDWSDPACLVVRADNDQARFIALPERVSELLETYRDTCPYSLEPGTPLFRGTRGGRLNPGVLQRQLRRLRGRLALSQAVTPSGFRRWFARVLVSHGDDWSKVRDRLGYARTSTVRRAVRQ